MKITEREKSEIIAEENAPRGLTKDEVAEQIAAGNVNRVKEKVGKSYGKIIADNLFTYFNLIWLIIAIVIIAVESYSNLVFLFIVIPNILIAIILEFRAKRKVEKLSVTTQSLLMLLESTCQRSTQHSKLHTEKQSKTWLTH